MSRGGLRLDGALVAAIAMAAIFAYALFEIQRLSGRSQQFPLATALPGLAVALAVIVRELRQPPRPISPEGATTRRAVAHFAAYFAGVFIAGFAATTAVFTALYLWREAELPWPIALGAAVAGVVTVLVFANTLHVPLPEGLIAPLLPRIGG
jgi:tripartite tricarboxylate transporter TctB family protein